MIRVAFCTAALIAFIWAVKAGLMAGFTNFGFWPGLMICLGFTAICGIIAFSWDYLEGRRSRELQQQAPHDPQLPER